MPRPIAQSLARLGKRQLSGGRGGSGERKKSMYERGGRNPSREYHGILLIKKSREARIR